MAFSFSINRLAAIVVVSSNFPRVPSACALNFKMPKNKVLVGVTGSVAAIKVPELVQELRKVTEVQVTPAGHETTAAAIEIYCETAPLLGRGLM